MRLPKYKQVSTRTEQRVIHHDAEYAEDGSIICEAWDKTVEVQVPVMGWVYRDATPEEIAEMERQQAELPPTRSYARGAAGYAGDHDRRHHTHDGRADRR